jgi:membrane protein insertase Oxa1/YidC/SpoIIIJ
MIVSTIELVLTPVIWTMTHFLELLRSLTGSAGTSIVLLAVLVALATYPLRAWAQRAETRVNERKKLIDHQISKVSPDLKGEGRFRAIESIYEAHGYHPIQSIGSGLTFLVMLPFLLSAIFVLADNTSLANVPYLFIPDLSRPDGLIGGINLMPFMMSGITVADARSRFATDRAAFWRFCFIALVLFVLVYSFSSALVLYWAVSNFVSWMTYLATSPSIPDSSS